MNFVVQSILLVMSFGYAAKAQNVTQGFDFQLFMVKFASLEQMIGQLQTDMKKQNEANEIRGDEFDGQFQQLQTEMREQREALDRHHDEMTSNFQALKAEMREHVEALKNGSIPVNPPDNGGGALKSCTGQTTSGPCQLQVADTTIDVFYENCLYGGGWYVIQSRFDGSVNFFRNWTEYVEGFGSVDGEHWLGLRNIRLLTSLRHHELLVHLEDFSELQTYARYSKFKIGNDNQQYQLETLGSHSGTAVDSLSDSLDHGFSTYNWDNDDWKDGNCAKELTGAWWYEACGRSNLNGKWVTAMTWDLYNKQEYPLKVSKMMIRPV